MAKKKGCFTNDGSDDGRKWFWLNLGIIRHLSGGTEEDHERPQLE
jgi:hypothetical protein